MNEALSTVDGRSVLRMQRWFSHPIEKVWRAVTCPGEMRHWFPSDVAMDFRTGRTIRFVFRQGEGPDLEGRILELDEPRLFSFLWGGSVLRFELRPEEGADGPGCRLLFSHTFDDRVSAASYAAGWQICFDNLYLLTEAKPSDVGLDQWAALHDGYVRQFGLGAGTLETAVEPGGVATGWTVRFERQLTRPVDDVWLVLTEGRAPAVGDPVPAPFTRAMAAAQLVASPSVIAVDPPRLLEYAWQAAGAGPGAGPVAVPGAGVGPGAASGRVRWELSQGNGGARLDLVETVPANLSDEPQRALMAWAEALEALARRLRS